MAKLISKTYGEALFELALEKNELDTMAEQVALLAEAFAENPELTKLLSHPKISKEEKISVVENIFKGRFSDDIVGFLVIIVEKDRGSEIESILELFQAKVREYKKIGVALVTSAVELSEAQKAKVEHKLLEQTAYEQFEITYVVDASLIGGMIIRIGDRVVDSSIRSKLDLMTRDLRKISLD
ncbi:MAG: ATP synthase F1 subunit delta [Lachnospiraceae bacterium]|nr:ATP synthase F1 subunit delta [Lachnospiraceae bacterium]